jgi:hypothetical protein
MQATPQSGDSDGQAVGIADQSVLHAIADRGIDHGRTCHRDRGYRLPVLATSINEHLIFAPLQSAPNFLENEEPLGFA